MIAPTQDAIFEWYDNEVEESLAKLYRVDITQRQRIVEIIGAMRDSNLFWKMMNAYDGALDEAEAKENVPGKRDVLLALLARMYIAGSLTKDLAVDL